MLRIRGTLPHSRAAPAFAGGAQLNLAVFAAGWGEEGTMSGLRQLVSKSGLDALHLVGAHRWMPPPAKGAAPSSCCITFGRGGRSLRAEPASRVTPEFLDHTIARVRGAASISSPWTRRIGASARRRRVPVRGLHARRRLSRQRPPCRAGVPAAWLLHHLCRQRLRRGAAACCGGWCWRRRSGASPRPRPCSAAFRAATRPPMHGPRAGPLPRSTPTCCGTASPHRHPAIADLARQARFAPQAPMPRSCA